MELVVSIVAVLVMTFLSGGVLSRVYDGDGEPRFFSETHVGVAAVNALVVGGLLAFFFQMSLVPVLAVPLLMVASWCSVRVVAKRTGQMIIWDKIDVRRLGLCLLVGVFATYIISSVLGVPPGFGPLNMGLVYAACWALLFPI
jgi:hypothetical protein